MFNIKSFYLSHIIKTKEVGKCRDEYMIDMSILFVQNDNNDDLNMHALKIL